MSIEQILIAVLSIAVIAAVTFATYAARSLVILRKDMRKWSQGGK